MRKIVVEIKPDGTSSIDAQGFQGQSCALATRELELVLAGPGGEIKDNKKPDFYVQTGTGIGQRS